jgi:hypothetical protein
VADTWSAAAAAIAARWDHGHDELTDGCALCLAEFEEARTWAQTYSLETQ